MRNRPFATVGHMVQKPPCWMANCALRHQKQRKVKVDWLKSLCSEGFHIPLPSSIADFVPRDQLLQKAYFNLLAVYSIHQLHLYPQLS